MNMQWDPTLRLYVDRDTGQTYTQQQAIAEFNQRTGRPPVNPGGGTGSNFSFNLGTPPGGGGTGSGPGLGQINFPGGGDRYPLPGSGETDPFNPRGGGPFGPTITLPTPPGSTPPGPTIPNNPQPTDKSKTPASRNTWQQILDAILGRGGGQGTLPAILGLLGNLGRNAAALEAGRAQGRIGEANIANQYDRLNLLRNQQYGTRAETELDQRRYIDDRYQRQLGNAVWGSAIPNIEDVQFTGLPERVASHIPTVTGGLRPSAIHNRQEIGDLAYREAMMNLLNPLAPGTAPEGTANRLAELPTPPALSPIPEANAFDTGLNYLSLIGLLPGSRPASGSPPANTSPNTNPNANNPYGDLTLPTTPTQPPASLSDTPPLDPRTRTAAVEPAAALGPNVGLYAPIPIERPTSEYDDLYRRRLPRISDYAFAGRTA